MNDISSIPDRVPLAIDFYNNDIHNMGDNCFETDGGARNIRVFKNRCFNSAAGALSVQPMFGGPVYFYQNLVYNTPTGSLKYIDPVVSTFVCTGCHVGFNKFVQTSTATVCPLAQLMLKPKEFAPLKLPAAS